MDMNTGAAKSPWTRALSIVVSIALVTVIGVLRDWDLESWIIAVFVFTVGSVVSSISRLRRNRRLDLMAKQAREMDSRSESAQSAR
jgi:hypothetical protein